MEGGVVLEASPEIYSASFLLGEATEGLIVGAPQVWDLWMVPEQHQWLI